MERITVYIGWADKNYSAYTDDFERIGGTIISTGKTLESVKSEFLSALQFHIEGCMQDGDKLHEWFVNGNYKIDFKLETSALLHSFDGILTRSALSRITGINERQIGHYATGLRKPRIKQREKIILGFHKIGKELSAVL